MPKRSNEFQRIVYLVRQALADGATVSESKMMKDRITKTPREVDIVIDGFVGRQRVAVSIECRDHKRSADVAWVEQMKAKHERLNTNALILCSRSGFTPEARRVAQSSGIETYALEDVELADFKGLLGENGILWAKSIEVNVATVKVDFEPFEDLPSETLAASADNSLYGSDGVEIGALAGLAEAAVRSDRMMKEILRDATEDHKWVEITWVEPRDTSGSGLWMQKLEPSKLRPISRVRIAGPIAIKITKFGMNRGKLGDIHFAWSKGNIGGRDATLVAAMTPDGTKKISVMFGSKGPVADAT